MAEAYDYGLSNVWDLLKAGDVAGMCNLFCNSYPHFDEPFEGSIRGVEELTQYVNAILIKIRFRNVSWEHRSTIVTPQRVVCEWQMNAEFERGRFAPPYAAVGDLVNGKFSFIRIYYSTWPQTGSRGIRLPVLQPDNSIMLHGVVAYYQRALAMGDLDGILQAFEHDGFRRDPRGLDFVYRGRSQLREFYGMLFQKGGIPLQFCTVTDDGVSCVIEYICDRWGKCAVPPQAGVSVYTRGTTGRIAVIRTYDDIDPTDVEPIRVEEDNDISIDSDIS